MKSDKFFIYVLVVLLILSPASLLALPDTTAPESAPPNVLASISIGKIFTYFMVMLGPIKLLGPFVKISRGMDAPATRMLALKGFGIACFAGLVAAMVGKQILNSWGVSLPALLLAAGLVLLLVALKAVLAQYEPPAGLSAETDSAPKYLALSPLAFPNIITPYGIAALILLDAAVPAEQAPVIFGVFLAVMCINLVAMLFARTILKYGADVLTILGAVLGVLQVALAIQMLMLACRMLGIIQ
ncbi:hypothetical protein MCAMS1_01118 [biofilm metagenome]